MLTHLVAVWLPADLLKVRAQAMDPASGRPFYSYSNKWVGAMIHIYQHEGGLSALYR